MGCPLNSKKLLFISWNGSHKIEHTHVSRWGSWSWHKYEVDRSCSICGCGFDSVILNEAQMQARGYDLNKLRKISSRDIFSKEASELKVGA